MNEQEILQELSKIYHMNLKQSDEAVSSNVRLFYLGKATGIQEAMVRICNDDEFSASLLEKWDSIYKALEVIEEVDKKWKDMHSGE